MLERREKRVIEDIAFEVNTVDSISFNEGRSLNVAFATRTGTGFVSGTGF